MTRYHSLSIVLHWLIALGLVFMLGSGLFMVNAEIPKAEQYKLFQIHKAAGVVMLWAILLRVMTRWLTIQPSLPEVMTEKEKALAKLGHIFLYVGLLIMPLSGWLMVSASPFGLPTFVFVDWIKWPHIPYVERNKAIESVARDIHWWMACILVILIVGHIAAVIKHKRQQKLSLIKRMWWSKTN